MRVASQINPGCVWLTKLARTAPGFKVREVDNLYKDVRCCAPYYGDMVRIRTKDSEENLSSINTIEMKHVKNTRVVVHGRMYIKMLSHREWNLHTDL